MFFFYIIILEIHENQVSLNMAVINKINTANNFLSFRGITPTQERKSYTPPTISLLKSPDRDVFIPSKRSLFSDPETREAVIFAIQKHDGKYRKHPTKKIPYVTHCINVGEKLQKAGFGKDTVIAGILHDTVEDTDTTYKELEKKFGSRVSHLVQEVSHSKKNVSWEEKQISYLKHIQHASIDAQAISAFDKIDNMNSSIECLEEGLNIFAHMKATPKKQLKKWNNLRKVYEKTNLPDEIKKEYRNTLEKLCILTAKNHFLY